MFYFKNGFLHLFSLNFNFIYVNFNDICLQCDVCEMVSSLDPLFELLNGIFHVSYRSVLFILIK